MCVPYFRKVKQAGDLLMQGESRESKEVVCSCKASQAIGPLVQGLGEEKGTKQGKARLAGRDTFMFACELNAQQHAAISRKAKFARLNRIMDDFDSGCTSAFT